MPVEHSLSPGMVDYFLEYIFVAWFVIFFRSGLGLIRAYIRTD